MQSKLNPKLSDDPHDVLEVAPGVVLVAPAEADEEISNLLRAAARQHSDPQVRQEPNFSASPPVRPVDTTFRAAATDNVKVPRRRRLMGARAIRGLMGFLFAVGLGVAAAVWQAYGDEAQQMIADWTPQHVLALLLPQQNPAPAQPAPPAADATQANATAAQPSPPAQAAGDTAAPAAAPSSAEAPSMQSMARDLAAAGQQIEQLKASIEQLKASQEQMSRDMAKAPETKGPEPKASETRASETRASETRASETRASEPNLRPKLSALPPRPAAVPARKPAPSFRASQAAAPYVPPPAASPYVPPQAAAPYAPRQLDPLPPPAAPPPLDPELASVPRPPMPIRE
jgi:hypothetical protein